MTSTASAERASSTAPVAGDQAERAMLGRYEDRIADPLPLGAVARAALAWFSALSSALSIPRDRRARRMVQLQLGLILYGVSDGMILMSGLGANPWDVFHQGLARHIGLPVGTTVILVGAVVMLAWIPIRQKPGFGTLSNVVVVGLAMDGAMAWLPTPHAWWLRWGEMLAGIVLNGVATGSYIGAGMGPGPRDGVMTGYAARGHSIRVVRTSMELTVLAAGWLLGGTVGIGTAAYALLIGPLAHRFIPLLAIRPEKDAAEQDMGQRNPAEPNAAGQAARVEKPRRVASGQLVSENC
ncbi:putative membrane protein YczE [Catenulispora sp. GP43]|uniref:membrane protein YczE n=1 Tax=Catenulispora sp. GP43 TaxID=3156263 RepID=UPI00351634A4